MERTHYVLLDDRCAEQHEQKQKPRLLFLFGFHPPSEGEGSTYFYFILFTMALWNNLGIERGGEERNRV